MTAPANYEYTIPSCLKPGYYLVRHEIIALHSAYSYPGAQFYPGCHQLQVTGSGTKTPSSGLVSFPGAYKSTDPGVTYDAYQGEFFNLFFLSFPFGKDEECGGETRGREDVKMMANGDKNSCHLYHPWSCCVYLLSRQPTPKGAREACSPHQFVSI